MELACEPTHVPGRAAWRYPANRERFRLGRVCVSQGEDKWRHAGVDGSHGGRVEGELAERVRFGSHLACRFIQDVPIDAEVYSQLAAALGDEAPLAPSCIWRPNGPTEACATRGRGESEADWDRFGE